MTDDPNNIQQQTEAIRQQRIEAARLAAEIENLDAQRRAGIELTETQKRSLVDLTRQQKVRREEIERETKALEELKKANAEYNEGLENTKGFLTEITGINMKLLDSFKKNEKGQRDFSKASKTVVTGMLSFAKAMDKQNVTLARATGYATAFQDNLVDLADANNGLYLSVEQGTQVLGGLSTQFSDFNFLSEEAQRSTAKLTGRFLNMGMSAEVSAKALDALKRGMKFNQTTAEATLASFEDLSLELGTTVGKVAEDFNDLSPALARFGVAGPRVFRDLANQARSLGMTTRQAFDFTEMFDTFEGSADVAGKLNAQLGLQLNSVEMMSASSEERLKILRAEFNMQGTNFKDMSRRQKQMIADIMGTDVDMAARLFGDPMEMRKAQRDQIKNQERQEKFIDISQRWQSSMQQFFINISPIIDVFGKALVGISQFFNDAISSPFGKMMSYVLGLGSAVHLLVKGFKYLGKVWRVLGVTARGFMTVLGPILGVLAMINDLAKMVFGDETQKKEGQSGAIGGAIGAALGAAVGSIVPGLGTVVGGAVGYGLGSMAASFMSDGEIGPGDSKVISQAGRRPIKTRPDDTIFMGTGDIHRTLKQIADNTSMTREGQKFSITAPVEIDLYAEGFRQKVVQDVMFELNPVR